MESPTPPLWMHSLSCRRLACNNGEVGVQVKGYGDGGLEQGISERSMGMAMGVRKKKASKGRTFPLSPSYGFTGRVETVTAP